MNREIKFELIYKHPDGKVLISAPYTIEELLDTDEYEIQSNVCTCDCQPIGETNVIECNCEDYYNDFQLINKRQFTGLKDKNGKEIYEGDILQNPEGKKGIVIYLDGAFRLQTHKSNTSMHYITLNQGFCMNKTIVGNIYEHPELTI